jgi:CheY-like chemotaxis protein
LVADDRAVRCDALVAATERSGHFEVVGAVGDGFAAVNEAKAQQPDVTVLALSLPRLSGLDAARYVRAAVPDGVVVVASDTWSEEREEDDPERDVAFAAGLLRSLADPRAVDAMAESVDLPSSPRAAALAREYVDERLAQRGTEEVAGVATLLVSEIVTNAIVHARSESRLRVALTNDAVHVAVTDWGDGAVTLREVDRGAVGGRGLRIVDALARTWGTVASRGSKTVCFEVGLGPLRAPRGVVAPSGRSRPLAARNARTG